MSMRQEEIRAIMRRAPLEWANLIITTPPCCGGHRVAGQIQPNHNFLDLNDDLSDPTDLYRYHLNTEAFAGYGYLPEMVTSKVMYESLEGYFHGY